MVPKVVLGPSDVKLMFIIADKLLVFILEKKKCRVFWGTEQKQCRVSVLFRVSNSCPIERLWTHLGHFV